MSERRFARYDAYKDSGVEWLGEIPVGWEVKRLRFVSDSNPVPSEVRGLPSDTEVSFVPMEAVGEYGGLVLATTKLLADVKAGYTYFRDGDVVIAKITPCFENGKGAHAAGLTNGIAFGTTELHVLRTRAAVDQRFAFYLTLSDAFRRIGEADMYGAGGQKRISESFVRNFPVGLPSHPEQRAIAEFLDRETARIDALVAKKERLITLLQERRTALITRAVTKGLDPAAPMKDSGVEWLGEIPAHWAVLPLKHLLSRCEYGISEDISGTGPIRVLTMAHIQDGEVLMPDVGSVAEVGPEMLLDHDDLLFNRTNSRDLVGKVGIFRGSRGDFATFASYLVRLTARPHNSAAYLNYLLNSAGVLSFARSLAVLSVNQANLNPTRYTQIQIPRPSFEEQLAISAYVGVRVAQFERLIARIRTAITHLHELRTALISAAVTGKIDVREGAG